MSSAPADLGRKVKTALDETRLLMLGAQVLFGFHSTAYFRKHFRIFQRRHACSIASARH
jgi:hypothetical protein